MSEERNDTAAAIEAEASAEENCEYFEIEVSEDDILYYLVDENDNEVGFAVMEDGKEVEYFYADDGAEYEYADAEDAPTAANGGGDAGTPATQDAQQKLRNSTDSITDKAINALESDELVHAATDFAHMYKETAEATKEIREAMKDVKDTIDMFNPKKLFR